MDVYMGICRGIYMLFLSVYLFYFHKVCHFVWCYLQVSSIDNIRSGRAVRFAIPTGAVGNIMAGILAREMGMPATFVAGVNANDIMDRVVQTGDYVIQAMQRTLSEAINIQCPYNFERILFYLSGQDAGFVRHWYRELARTNGNHLPYGMHQKLRMFVQTAKIDDDVMLKTMQTYWQKHGYVCDPHTAVALAAVVQVDSLASRPLASSASVTLEPSSSFSSSPSPSPSPSSSSSKGPVTVVLSTAHPAKFEEALRAGLGDAFWRENYAVDATNPLKRGKRMPALAAQLYSKAVVGGRTVFPQGSDFTARLTQLVQEEVLAPMAAKVKLRGKL